MDNSNIKLSIVIRCRNEAVSLQNVFAALHAQRCDFAWETIVVDNDSDDDTRKVASENDAIVVPISQSDFTYGRALNVGISHARGDLILILSAHSIPLGRHFIQDSISPFIDKNVAAVRCLCANSTPNQITTWYAPQIISYSSAQQQKRNETGIKWTSLYPTATCCVIRRSVWEQVKYNENIEAVEDKLWASQVLSKGYKILCCAEAFFYYSRKYTDRMVRQRNAREYLALYRITGYKPLTMASFIVAALHNVCASPVIAIKKTYSSIAHNYLLLTIPYRAKKKAHQGSIPGFDKH